MGQGPSVERLECAFSKMEGFTGGGKTKQGNGTITAQSDTEELYRLGQRITYLPEHVTSRASQKTERHWGLLVRATVP